MEEELMEKADIVFTGGNCLYEAKKHRHDNIFSFPSSIDKKHFMQARENIEEQADQANIPYPRLGFFGVLDERFDIELIEKAATLKPEWQFVLIGPVVKIDPNTLPKNENIHYLGGKSYQELPKYLSGWDVALIPFAINESTRFISPTKTPEYLAAGKPVVSSPIRDVVNPYSDNNLVHIYNDAFEFVEKVSDELAVEDKSEWLGRVDDFLSNISWDSTFEQMNNLIKKGMVSSKSVNIVKLPRLRRTEKIMERVNYQL
jgi:glycosyltransferase involved in cell wall biosynthesis